MYMHQAGNARYQRGLRVTPRYELAFWYHSGG